MSDAIKTGRVAGVFCALHLRQFTGVVFVGSDERQGVFSFRDGNPVFVEMDAEPPISDWLLERGLIDQTQYTEVVSRASESVEKSEDVAFCERAIELGVLSREQVDAEMSRRVRGRVIEAIVWEGCRIEIDESRDALSGIREYPQPLGPLVYMGVRTFYEEAQVRALLGDLDALYLRLNRPLRKVAEFFDFDMQERALVGRFDPEVPVANTVEASATDALEAWQLVCMIGLAGMAELSSVPFASAPEPSGIRDRPPSSMPQARPTTAPPHGSRKRVSTGRMPVVREEVGRRTVDRMPVVEDGGAARRPVLPPKQESAGLRQARPVDAYAPTEHYAARSSHPGRGMVDRMPVVEQRAFVRHPTTGAPGGPTVPMEHAVDASKHHGVTRGSSAPPVDPRPDPTQVKSRGRARPRSTTAVSRLGEELRKRRVHEKSSPPPEASTQTAEDYAHVKQLLQRRRVAERVKEEQLDAVASQYGVALELLREQHFSRAVRLLADMCEAQPTNSDLQMYRLWAELRSGGSLEESSRDALRRLCRDRLEKDDHKSFAHYALGYMSLQEGKEDVALRHFRKAIAADKNNTNAERHLRILERRREAARSKG